MVNTVTAALHPCSNTWMPLCAQKTSIDGWKRKDIKYYYKCIAKSTAVFTSLCIQHSWNLSYSVVESGLYLRLSLAVKLGLKYGVPVPKPGFKRPVCFCFFWTLPLPALAYRSKRPHGAKIRYFCWDHFILANSQPTPIHGRSSTKISRVPIHHIANHRRMSVPS